MSVSKQERKAVLDLFPYFSKNPVVFDVGSNKGDFAELFVDNVSEIHLFEPNELLLHYSMVRFCDRNNAQYSQVVVGSGHFKTADLMCFSNENNGLSNIFFNPKWLHLPYKTKCVGAITLDYYWNNSKAIDLLKIDVEGAEMLVLLGSEKLLTSKIIKFIQVEKAEHILLSHYTFDDLINYLSDFGYIPMPTDDTENVIFMQEGFTQDWNGEFKKNTSGMKFDFALEIGAFEGLTSRYICDNLLNTGGRMICIDPLTDEYLPGHEDNNLFVGQYERFTRNTRGYPIELIRKKSIDSFAQLQDYRFDFIYIDGDHRENEVYLDAINSFKILKVGGHILFDDYEWREETKRGIDRFLNELSSNKMTIVLKGYQVMIKKHENL